MSPVAVATILVLCWGFVFSLKRSMWLAVNASRHSNDALIAVRNLNVCAQVGAIVGSTIAANYTKKLGFEALFLMEVCSKG
jgi:predicted MFS family arabinose efflux permease